METSKLDDSWPRNQLKDSPSDGKGEIADRVEMTSVSSSGGGNEENEVVFRRNGVRERGNEDGEGKHRGGKSARLRDDI